MVSSQVFRRQNTVESPQHRSASPATHWSAFSRIWDLIAPPLRPSAQDVDCYSWHVSEWARLHGPPRGVILGVTPELARLPWPKGSIVRAVDRSPEMIERVWPGPRTASILADWTAISLPTSSVDLVLCDLGLVQVSYPEGLKKIARSLRRILRPEGLFIGRLCVPPEVSESTQEVLDEWKQGGLSNASLLKLRLGMSLQPNSSAGVQLGQIWNTWSHAANPSDRFAAVQGWTSSEAKTLLSYRQNRTTYHFASVREVAQIFTHDPGGFVTTSLTRISSPFGNQCPILSLARA